MKKISRVLLVFFISTTVLAHNTLMPPFYDVAIAPHRVLAASYDFVNPAKQRLDCWDSSVNHEAKASWTFQGQTYSDNLAISLKADASMDGKWADKKGSLFITNTGNDSYMLVSCHYHEIK